MIDITRPQCEHVPSPAVNREVGAEGFRLLLPRGDRFTAIQPRLQKAFAALEEATTASTCPQGRPQDQRPLLDLIRST